jgi:hypothetical protein
MGDRDDKLPTASAIFSLLKEYLVRNIPRKQKHVIRLGFQQLFRRIDAKMSSRRIASLLRGSLVDHITENI